ncbi:MAG TPA: tetratricopeptide repeat protein [Acetobacteraceae bacterium]|nr:tetratricopeptide repeat protein [Acetobacteraceae bacterium]
MWDSREITADLAGRYHDAALSGVDMRKIANALETIRSALLAPERTDCDWDVVDDQIVLAFGQPEQALLTALRESLAVRHTAAELDRIHLLTAADRTAGAQAWLAAIAAYLARWRIDLAERLAAAGPEPTPELADLIARVRPAFELIRNGRWAEAEPMVFELARAAFLPAVDRARLLVITGLIHLFFFTGRGRSEELIAEALGIAPEDAHVMLASGEALLDRRDVAGARETAQRSLAFRPDMAEAHCLLGDCELRRGAVGDAEKHYRRGCAAHPGNGTPYLRLLSLAGNRGDTRDLDGCRSSWPAGPPRIPPARRGYWWRPPTSTTPTAKPRRHSPGLSARPRPILVSSRDRPARPTCCCARAKWKAAVVSSAT